MKHFLSHLRISLLTFTTGVIAYASWNFIINFQMSVPYSKTNTCFIVKPVSSKETNLISEYINKYCTRRNWNPEQEKLLVGRLNQIKRHNQKSRK
jgi:hypothetical protein